MAGHVDGDHMTAPGEGLQDRIPEGGRAACTVEQNCVRRFGVARRNPVCARPCNVGLVMLDIDLGGTIESVSGCPQPRTYRPLVKRQCRGAA